MNRKRITACALAVSLSLTAFSLIVEGDEIIYDSTSDPLVSLSYINDVVTPAYDAKIAELNTTITQLTEKQTLLLTTIDSLTTKNAELEKSYAELLEKSSSFTEVSADVLTKINSLESSNAALAESNKSLADENSALKTLTDELSTRLSALEEKVKDQPEEKEDGYVVVYLTKGQKLLAETPCELILRSGTAIAVSITTNGLNDITDGSELHNADAIPQYHSLLVPRGGDGRGIQITSADAYVMARGGYKVVN